MQVDKPVTTIKPIETNQTQELRPFGLCAGEFRVPDDFDAPLPEKIIQQFERKQAVGSNSRTLGTEDHCSLIRVIL